MNAIIRLHNYSKQQLFVQSIYVKPSSDCTTLAPILARRQVLRNGMTKSWCVKSVLTENYIGDDRQQMREQDTEQWGGVINHNIIASHQPFHPPYSSFLLLVFAANQWTVKFALQAFCGLPFLIIFPVSCENSRLARMILRCETDPSCSVNTAVTQLLLKIVQSDLGFILRA